MEKTAVVLLNWNGRNFLEKFLPFVLKYTPNTGIYVADNDSTDGSVEFLKAQFPSVKIIQNSTNCGFSKGYNVALEQVEAEYFVLLNSDVEVTYNWLDPIIQFMDANPKIGACQPKIKSYHQKSHFEYAGAGGGFIDSLGYPYCRGRIFDTLEADTGQYNDVTPIFWATGACMIVKASAYHEVNGLDNDFFAHMEEIDMCWRLQKQGWQIYYYGKSEVFHVGGGTLSKSNPKKTYLNFRNNLSLLVKNHPEKNFWSIIFLRLILDGAAGLRFLFSSGFKHFTAVIEAHFNTYANFNILRKKRNSLKIFNKEVYGITPNSIVWEYYIKKRKKFSELNKK